MCVAEHDGVQGTDVERKRFAVPLMALSTTLNHPAVEKQARGAGIDEMARAGNLPGRTVKRQTHGQVLYMTTQGARDALL